ncbi:MAG: hypothetical protein JNK05_32650 [Myxococcales bacterium]|nr:hypothetical protein [Myxococcales bacterium]
MKTLIPCSACGRHVRANEEACPFCGATVSASASNQPSPAAKSRLGRAALFAFGATIAATTASCAPAPGPSDTGVVNDVQMQDSANMALYGAPAPDVMDEGSPMARYGAVPAPDVEASDAADTGMPMARYGGPPADV